VPDGVLLRTKSPITVTVLTKNEEALIQRCISSVTWADEVLILDCGSNDRTRELARASGATVYEQPWLGWVRQRQRALELARHDWILVLEADEIVTPELARSIIRAMAASPRAEDGYVVDRRDELFGTLLPNMKRPALRRSFVRLLNRTRSHYDPVAPIHETVLCPGRAIPLEGLLLHWRGVTFIDQMHKDIENAVLEAKLLADKGVRVRSWRLLLSPVMRFAWCYVCRGAWRLGATGLVYSLMRAHTEFLRHGVLWEQQNTTPSPHPGRSVWDPHAMPVVEPVAFAEGTQRPSAAAVGNPNT
jgi:(heptosyl)LPS beta-1,4-glucosyltransferase